MTQRSHWAWGTVARFPADDVRSKLAQRVAQALGISVPTLEAVPSLNDARLPSPRVEPPRFASATSDREARIRHTYGRGYPDIFRAYGGDFSKAPDVVAYPESDAEVHALLQWAASECVAVIPHGGGTSVVGGVESDLGAGHRGTVVLSTRRMNRMLEVDRESLAAHLEAGMLGPEVERALSEHGLTLRHYPQSFEFSTLGGWIVTRAGGHHATLYTHIDDLVQNVTIVTTNGIFSTPRFPASGAGPSIERLMCGSEGAFGVLARAWLRVSKRPEWRASATMFFDTFEKGARAAQKIAQAKLYPSNCRLLDPMEAAMNRVPSDGGAVLLLGFESTDGSRRALLEEAIAIATKEEGRKAADIEERFEGKRGAGASAETWRQAFFDGPYLQSALVTMGVMADTFETACTWSQHEQLQRRVRAAVHEAMAAWGHPGIVTCRFTHVYPDGPAPYFTFITPAANGKELDQWQSIKQAACDALLASGGTITHHHAVGRVHRPWYVREQPELARAALRGVKDVLDPLGIMNPGVLLPHRTK